MTQADGARFGALAAHAMAFNSLQPENRKDSQMLSIQCIEVYCGLLKKWGFVPVTPIITSDNPLKTDNLQKVKNSRGAKRGAIWPIFSQLARGGAVC